MKPENCLHQRFDFKPKATWLSNVHRYIFEVAVRCADCKQRFAFQGLPVSAMDLNGACMTADGSIGKFSMAPLNAMLPPLDDMPIANLPEYVPGSIAGPESGPMGGGYLGEDDDGEPEPPAPADFTVVE